MPEQQAPADTARVCMRQCGARCCQGASYLLLAPHESREFAARAAALGVRARLRPRPGGATLLRFLEHAGECCPMLEQQTSRCRIYEHRPMRCRAFPETLRPGCALSWDICK